MAKISANTIKKTGWTVSIIWLIVFLGFIVFMTRIQPTVSQPWTKPLATGIVSLVGGIVMVVFSFVYTLAAWNMSADEHHDMLIEISFFGRLNERSLSILPKSYWLWQNRILFLFVTPFGLVLAGVGAGILVMTTITYLLK